jgi:hypothetical protein
MASASDWVSVIREPEPNRTPPERDDPELMSNRLAPSPDTIFSISFWVPCPTDTITMTAAMPMITPSEVNALRSQLPRREETAVRKVSIHIGGILGHYAVEHMADAVGMRRDMLVVSNQDDGVSLLF